MFQIIRRFKWQKILFSKGWLASPIVKVWGFMPSGRCFSASKGGSWSCLRIWQGCLLGGLSRHVPLRGNPRADPGQAGETISFGWLGSTLVFPRTSWKRWLGRRRSMNKIELISGRIRKREWMDGWIELKTAMALPLHLEAPTQGFRNQLMTSQ